jgi:ankyrin repeat protein
MIKNVLHPVPLFMQTIPKLVFHGADISVKDNNGEPPLDIARRARNNSVINYLSGLE